MWGRWETGVNVVWGSTGTADPPDDEGLLLVALCGEGDDVVAAAQLCKGMALGVALQLHAAAALSTVHNSCSIKAHS